MRNKWIAIGCALGVLAIGGQTASAGERARLRMDEHKPRRVRDLLWVWGNPGMARPGEHTIATFAHAGPARRARLLGTPNVVMAGRGLPDTDAQAEAETRGVLDLERLVWEISGTDGQWVDKDAMARVRALADRYPKIEGVLLDDLSTVKIQKGFRPDHIRQIRALLADGDRPVDIWGVWYTMTFDQEGIGEYIKALDVINLWTWHARDLVDLEKNVAHCERIYPDKPIVIGLYLYDYGGGRRMPLDLLKHQCETALALAHAGRIAGIVFLTINDDAETVGWTADWIRRVGDQKLGAGQRETKADARRPARPVGLSNHPQLFLDDFLIARSDNVKKVLQQPAKHPDNPLDLKPEHPWERSRMDAGSVLYDAARKKFHMWYPVLMDKARYADNFGYVCYAESSDGVHWTRPMMRICDFEGTLPTNIVTKGPSAKNSECLFPSVISTPHDPDRPYKMLFTHRRNSEDKSRYGLHVSHSTDGLRWSEPRFIFQGKCDNPPSLVWFEPLGTYFGYCRAQDSHKDLAGHIRCTGILSSRDFDTWTPRRKVVLTDARDGYPFTQFHHVMVASYGDILIGMADVMHMTATDNKLSTEDVQIITSRDGWNWHRVADRAVFIPNTPDGYDAEMVSPRSAIVKAGDTIYIYYQGMRYGQGKTKRDAEEAFLKGGGTWRDRGGICLATLPADRFVAVVPESPGRPGAVQTPPLRTSGGTLLVNARLADPGDLRVELLDEKGSALPGFEADQSRLIRHDKLRYRATWAGEAAGRSLENVLARGPVALRFIIHKGSLFAFQFVE